MKKSLFLLALLFITQIAESQIKKYTVLFDFNKSEVPDSARNYLIQFAKKNKIGAIKFDGHCDSVGDKKYNYELSERRIQAVQEILKGEGVDAKFFRSAKGWGKDKPLNTNSTAEERQLNRRVSMQFFIGDKSKIKILKARSPSSKIRQKKAAKAGVHYAQAELKIGEVISIPGLNFQGGRHYLIEKSIPILDTVFDLFNQNPTIKFEIHGHVCCTGQEVDGYDFDTKTWNLSENRARAVKLELAKRGIDPDRMSIKAFGGTKKINLVEKSEAQRLMNRRVEFLILEK